MTSPLAPRGEGWGAGVRPVPAPHEARYSQSLERGLAILACFTPQQPVWGVRELARELQVSHSTMQRYVGTLVALGFLERVGDGRFRMTLAVARLGLSTMSGVGLYGQAHDEVVELAFRVRHPAAVAVLDVTEIVLVDYVEGETAQWPLKPGGRRRAERQPAYCTALGKVLLAFLPAYVRREILSGLVLSRRASGTIRSLRVLRRELNEIAESELGWADSELAEGVLAIAVPIRGSEGEVFAAVGIEAHRSSVPVEGMAARLGPHLRATASRISGRLGYRRTHELGIGSEW